MGIKVSYQPPAPVAALGSWLGGFGQFAQEERQRAQALAMERAKMAQQQQQHQDELALRAASMEQNAANQAADNAMRQQQLAMQGQQQQFNNQKDVANFWQDQQKMEMAPIMQEQAAKYQFDRQEAMQKAYQDRAEAQQNAVMQRQEDQQIEVAIRQAEEEAYKRVAAIKQFELDDTAGQKRDELISKFDPGGGGGIIGARSAIGGDPQLSKSYLDNVMKWNREVDMATPAIRAGLKNKPQVVQPQFIDGPEGEKIETGNLIGYDQNGRPFSLGKYKTNREMEAERKALEQKNFKDFYAETEKLINGNLRPGEDGYKDGDELDAEIHRRWNRMQANVQRAFAPPPQQSPTPLGAAVGAATAGMGMPAEMQGQSQMPQGMPPQQPPMPPPNPQIPPQYSPEMESRLGNAIQGAMSGGAIGPFRLGPATTIAGGIYGAVRTPQPIEGQQNFIPASKEELAKEPLLAGRVDGNPVIRVSSPAEAKKLNLKTGTLIMTPEGRLKRVP